MMIDSLLKFYTFIPTSINYNTKIIDCRLQNLKSLGKLIKFLAFLMIFERSMEIIKKKMKFDKKERMNIFQEKIRPIH